MAKSKALEAALRQRVQELENELKTAKEDLRQARDIMSDHLCSIGIREHCAHCQALVWWVHRHGTGTVILLNFDGTEHWPRCPKTPKPPAQAAAAVA